MISPVHNDHRIPQSSKRVHFSRAAAGLLGTTLILGVILVYSTVQNINKAEILMEQFLLDKGETILRSIEAGSRATMMHNMSASNPLHTFLMEFTRDKDIQYIVIWDSDGSVVEQVGNDIVSTLTPKEIISLTTTDATLKRLSAKDGVFSISKRYDLLSHALNMYMKNMPHHQTHPFMEKTKILSIGLKTEKFDTARKQDVRHSLFMGAILFLVSSAGLYLLFLYQKVRITSLNLSDMKLYTDHIIESIPVSLITLDSQDKIVSFNKNTEVLLHSTSLKNIRDVSIYSLLPSCSPTIEKSCKTGLEHEVFVENEKGSSTPIRVTCSPLVNEVGEAIGKVLILRDMTLIKDMEVLLERSRRMAALGKMAAGIAHEIRNPLGTLRGFIQFFSDESDSPEKQEYTKLIINEIDRLNRTVSGLLQFSRPREIEYRTINIKDLFIKSISLLQADIVEGEVVVESKADQSLHVKADPDLMLQVIINLLKNSINATPAGGEITLTACSKDAGQTISIIDTGRGMSKEEKEKMFDPFFTTDQSGTGLGLAICHQIIEQHLGRIEVRTQKGKGTKIAIHLPSR